jgi:hypothetical protein
MPWSVTRNDNEWCVVKDSTGEVEGCHDTQQKAYGQMSALYASEEPAQAAVMEDMEEADPAAPASLSARVARLEQEHAEMYQKIMELEGMLTRTVVEDLSPSELPMTKGN